jgi:nicotinate-nucleotide adenylyltransferase
MLPLIGIFGGTFDPPHRGHLALAAIAWRQLELTSLLWVLTPAPPHKNNRSITSIDQRLAMVELAIKGHPEFTLSRVDLDRQGPHYAVDTVEILARQNPGSGLIYLMGADSLRDLPTWRRPEDFLNSLQAVAVMRRPGYSIDLGGLEADLPGLKAKLRFVDAPPVDISAHEIRARAAADADFRSLVQPAVFRYIIDHRLYQDSGRNR